MRILMLNRRDTLNPEGGGSEVYLERIAAGLAHRGHDVTIFCGAHERAGASDVVEGVRFIRAGSKLGVHREALRMLRNGALGSPDVILDVQNGIPFFTVLAASGVPVVILVHHLHKEQWPVVYGPVRSRIGWALESRLAPRLYRKCAYVAVSEGTKAELEGVGVGPDRVTVIHNGNDPLPSPYSDDTIGQSDSRRDTAPRILVLGRLVPHKQVEHVLAAASTLRTELPGLTVSVVGDGWWSDELRDAARAHGVDDIVEFTGFLSEADKHAEIARAWVLALPSLKEGWGIVVMEAARHGVPAVGYRSASGVAESISDRRTGLLVDGGPEQFGDAVGLLLRNAALRARMGEAARIHARQYSWEAAVDSFEMLLGEAAGQQVVRLPVARDSGTRVDVADENSAVSPTVFPAVNAAVTQHAETPPG